MARARSSDRHQLVVEEPGRDFHESFLLGNGSFGAALLGGIGVEHIALNRDTFWSGGPSLGPAIDRSGSVDRTREAIRRNDFIAAHDRARELQSDSYTQAFIPLGSIDWAYAADSPSATGYSRRLDLAHAEMHTAYQATDGPVRLDAFLSAPADVLVLSTQSPRTGALDLPRFSSPHPVAVVETVLRDGAVLRVWKGRAPARHIPHEVDVPDPVTYDDAPLPGDGLVAAGMGFAVAALTQRLDGETRLIVAAADGYRGRRSLVSADTDEIAFAAIRIAERASRRTTDELRREHANDFATYFDRVDLELWNESAPENDPGAEPDDDSKVGPAEAELFFDLGRYLLICSSRPGGQPANLQGLWNDDPRPAWSSGYTTNINLQMNYWPAEPAGLSDLTEPLTSWVADAAVMGVPTARAIYHAPGWAMHHNSDLWGYTEPVAGEPQWSNWSSAGLWLAAQLAERFAYGREADFATTSLWPVLAGAAQFALSMLEPHDDGLLVSSPSTSPEHRFVADGRLVAVTRGSAMDQQLIAEALGLVVELHAQGLTPADEKTDELVKAAHSALRRLRPPVIGPAGTILEWERDVEPEDRGHRHLSHLYGLYPGSSIDEVETPERFSAAREALRERIDNGGGRTGWSQSWILCLAARLRDPDLVARSLDILVRDLSSRSMLDLHPHSEHESGYVFQIDGNMGAAAGILEAIIQSQRNVIRLLNAIPAEWDSGSLRGARARGGFSVDVSWHRAGFASASIHAENDGEITICLPTGSITATEHSNGVERPVLPAWVDAPSGRARFTWHATAGATLEIT